MAGHGFILKRAAHDGRQQFVQVGQALGGVGKRLLVNVVAAGGEQRLADRLVAAHLEIKMRVGAHVGSALIASIAS